MSLSNRWGRQADLNRLTKNLPDYYRWRWLPSHYSKLDLCVKLS